MLMLGQAPQNTLSLHRLFNRLVVLAYSIFKTDCFLLLHSQHHTQIWRNMADSDIDK